MDQENLQADYRDGVLYLTIPVAEQAQPRRIQVGQRQSSQLGSGSSDQSSQSESSGQVSG